MDAPWTRLAGAAVLATLIITLPVAAQSPTRLSVASNGAQALGGTSSGPAVSDDGRYIAFDSSATNLVANDANGRRDVFVRDRQTGTTTSVSLALTGVTANGHSFGPVISGDGRYVAFYSEASDLTGDPPAGPLAVYVRDRSTGAIARIAPARLKKGSAYDPSWAANNIAIGSRLAISGNGRVVAIGVALHDSVTGGTQLPTVCADPFAACQRPSLNADGRYLAFDGIITLGGEVPLLHQGHRDVFVYDRTTGVTSRAASTSGISCQQASVSGDGRHLTMQCLDVNSLSQIFVADRSTGAVTAVTGASTVVDRQHNLLPHISRNGRIVTFHSFVPNLSALDTNNAGDVFAHDRETGRTWRVSTGAAGEGDAVSLEARVGGDGRLVVFTSAATQLVANDSNGMDDVFAVDIGGQVDLSVATTLSPVMPGLTRTQTIAVRNGGSDAATGVLVGVVVGNTEGAAGYGMSLSSCEATGGGVCRLSATRASVSFPVLAPGASATITLRGGLYQYWLGFTNVVSVESHGRDTNPIDNTVSVRGTFNVPTVIQPIPHLIVDQGAPPSAISLAGVFADADPGETLSFSVSSNNNPGLVTPNVTGSTLTLTYNPSQSGGAVMAVRATDAFGLGGAFTNVLVTVRPRTAGAPVAPERLQAFATGNSVLVQWSAPAFGPAPTGYVLDVGLTPAAFTLASFPFGNVTSFSAVAPSGTYYLRLRATNASGASAPTPVVRLDVGCTAPPGQPLGLEATMTGANVHVQWAPASGNVERYILEVGFSAGAQNLVVPVSAATTSLDAAAPPGRYFLRVRAGNACDVGDASAEIFIVVGVAATLPGAPTGLTGTVNGSTVALSWTAPVTGTPATGYVLEAGTAPGLSNVARTILGPGPSLAVPGVPSGSYYVRVRAINAAGIGAASADVVVTVP